MRYGVSSSASHGPIRFFHPTGTHDFEKNDLKPWQKEQWCIPKVSNEFVWHMEDVLDLYALPYDPAYPQVLL